MDQQQRLITPGEAMKRLGLTRPYQLKRLVDAGHLKRIVLNHTKWRGSRGFYDERQVDDLAQDWQDEDKRYFVVA